MLRYRYGDTTSLVPGLADAHAMAVTATRLRAPSVLTDLSVTEHYSPRVDTAAEAWRRYAWPHQRYSTVRRLETLSNSSTVESSAVVSSVHSAMSQPSLGAWSNIHLSEQHNRLGVLCGLCTLSP